MNKVDIESSRLFILFKLLTLAQTAVDSVPARSSPIIFFRCPKSTRRLPISYRKLLIRQKFFTNDGQTLDQLPSTFINSILPSTQYLMTFFKLSRNLSTINPSYLYPTNLQGMLLNHTKITRKLTNFQKLIVNPNIDRFEPF